jgi:hypothetical protein
MLTTTIFVLAFDTLLPPVFGSTLLQVLRKWSIVHDSFCYIDVKHPGNSI